MPRPLDEDLRWRIVWLRVFLGSVTKVSELLCISEHSVLRITKQYNDNGCVKHLKIGCPLDSVSFHQDEELVLTEAILEHPEKDLSEIARDVFGVMGNNYALSTIHTYLKRNGVTRKKLKMIALQQNEGLRVEFIANVSQLEPNDRRVCRNKGYSLRGYRAEVRRIRCKWSSRLTAIPVICTRGFLELSIHRGTTNRERFLEFVQNSLAPNLLPFHGINPRSLVVIMDNAAIHHCHEVLDAIYATGAVVLFLSPYSPDLMPCEIMFSKAKAWLRSNDTIWQTCHDPETMLLETFMQISDEDILQFIRHCEYV
ncbi:hypothetical protein QZH41_017534 [Actinostola sp. cb2023]|nr:hypothetical protein QZH41_017534 [Actinostola sp. cb2023]